MTKRARERLRLRAVDPEDLAVISAVLQDAAARVGDMVYERRARRFVLVLNRYRWEATPDAAHSRGSRVRCGMHLSGVLAVRTKGIALDNPDQVRELLALEVAPEHDGAATIILVFAGGGSVRLAVECIACEMTDLWEPWPARHRPTHPRWLDG